MTVNAADYYREHFTAYKMPKCPGCGRRISSAAYGLHTSFCRRLSFKRRRGKTPIHERIGWSP